MSVLRLPVDAEGFISQQQLEEILSAYNQEGRFGNRRIRLVASSGCSNVVGAMNDLENMSAIVHRYGALLLVDTAQLSEAEGGCALWVKREWGALCASTV